MEQRNRAEGWRHAKLSGHENEALVEALTENDSNIQRRLLECVGKDDCDIVKIDFGGLREKDVASVLGDKTKSKTDMHLYLNDNSRVNVSIKKSLAGQVYLIRDARFIEGFEKQFNKKIPEDVKRAISLFWGSSNDVVDIIKNINGKNRDYELRKHRLVSTSLRIYSNDLYYALINWFNQNMCEVFDFCFSCGLASNKEDWADIIWYKNELHENEVDDLIFISNIKDKLTATAEYGHLTGGSTIQLPFGFVQWHQGQMQFHHNYYKIKDL